MRKAERLQRSPSLGSYKEWRFPNCGDDGTKMAILYIIYSVYIILCIHVHIIYMIYIVYIERLGGKYITCREGQGMAEWVNKEGENNKK